MITARHRRIALLVAGCYFMEMLDGTITSTAAPQIGRALRAPVTEVGLVITVYLLTLAVLIPLSGWLTRRLGNRVVFLTAIALFTLASIGCALAPNAPLLIAGRLVQGVGGAFLMANSAALVTDAFPRRELGRALGVNAMVVGAGLILGPILGG